MFATHGYWLQIVSRAKDFTVMTHSQGHVTENLVQSSNSHRHMVSNFDFHDKSLRLKRITFPCYNTDLLRSSEMLGSKLSNPLIVEQRRENNATSKTIIQLKTHCCWCRILNFWKTGTHVQELQNYCTDQVHSATLRSDFPLGKLEWCGILLCSLH